jgi:hypothetical protein
MDAIILMIIDQDNKKDNLTKSIHMNTQTLFFSWLCFAMVLLAGCATAEPEPITEGSLIDLFDHEKEVPELVLKTDYAPLVEDRTRKYQPAILEWEGQDTFNIRVKTRGKTRNKICDFPPLQLHFPESVLEENNFFPKHTLKLVTHCIADSTLVLKEFLAYKIYNELTEKSFKVQLIRLRYVDTNETDQEEWQYAFLIEHHDALAHRLGGKVLKNEPIRFISQEDYQRLTIFQYMIGNTDWNINRRHNIKMVQVSPDEAPIPVPYDFDYSGLINAPYAVPHPSLPIESVQERLFQWRGKDKEGLEQQLTAIVDQEKAIMKACERFLLLNQASRDEVKSYLDSFFMAPVPTQQ